MRCILYISCAVACMIVQIALAFCNVSYAVAKYKKVEQDAVFVVREEDGHVFYQKNAHKLRRPASLTKVMTLYLLFDAMRDGKLSMNSKIQISAKANSMPPSKLYLSNGSRISIREAILAAVVKSANNVAYAIAENIAGSEARFVAAMNRKAMELQMYDTHFANPHGLHHPKQYTTAYDMFLLSEALKKEHSFYYHFFSKTHFNFRGSRVAGHNRVLSGACKGVDGIKTGYTRASGFNIITSVRRDQGNIIAVVMGKSSAHERDSLVISLVEKFYKKLKRDIANGILPSVSDVLSRKYAESNMNIGIFDGLESDIFDSCVNDERQGALRSDRSIFDPIDAFSAESIIEIFDHAEYHSEMNKSGASVSMSGIFEEIAE